MREIRACISGSTPSGRTGQGQLGDRDREVADALERDDGDQADVQEALVAGHRGLEELEVEDLVIELRAALVDALVGGRSPGGGRDVDVVPGAHPAFHLAQHQAGHLDQSVPQRHDLGLQVDPGAHSRDYVGMTSSVVVAADVLSPSPYSEGWPPAPPPSPRRPSRRPRACAAIVRRPALVRRDRLPSPCSGWRSTARPTSARQLLLGAVHLGLPRRSRSSTSRRWSAPRPRSWCGGDLRRDHRVGHLGRVRLPARQPAAVRAAGARLVYLTGLRLSQMRWSAAHARAWWARPWSRVAPWAILGLTVLGRTDVAGAIGRGGAGRVPVRGRAPTVYAGVFFVAFLEIYGTAMGTWRGRRSPASGSPTATPRAGPRAGTSSSTSRRSPWRRLLLVTSARFTALRLPFRGGSGTPQSAPPAPPRSG